jgi:hypothetical protein
LNWNIQLECGISLLAMQPAGKHLRSAYIIYVILDDVLTSILTFAVTVRF